MVASAQHPKLVIFDAFNTLVRPVAGKENTFAEALASLGIDASPRSLARLQSASAGLDHRQWSGSSADYEHWTRQTLRRNGADLLGEYAPHVIPALEQWHQAPMEPFPDVHECLTSLRSTGITVAICSNWGWDLADDLASADVAWLADIVVSSAQAGCRKPHPEIYDTVLQLAGVQPADAVFVGDNIATDVLGPQRAGITGIYLDRTGMGSPDCVSVGSLTDLNW